MALTTPTISSSESSIAAVGLSKDACASLFLRLSTPWGRRTSCSSVDVMVVAGMMVVRERKLCGGGINVRK